MLSGLKLINCSPCAQLEEVLGQKARGQVFILRTCQRTLLLGFNRQPDLLLSDIEKEKEIYSGLEAYEFLLQTICGLKSRILGENEIVHQFKEAYGDFLTKEKPNRLIQQVLEKLFKDAKDIRTTHLRNLGLQTYAGITRKILSGKTKVGEKVYILGSGQLAEDFIKISRRRFTIILCARNQERVKEISEKYGVETLDWDKREEILLKDYVVNTIGTQQNIMGTTRADHIFKAFIDLGEPSPFTWLYGQEHFYSLEAIFAFGKQHREEKEEKVNEALEAIKEITKHRHGRFKVNIPFGWEELLFA